MRGSCHLAFYLSALLNLLPARAQGQQATKTLVLYYDSARTQCRAVYQALLRGPRPDTVAHGPFRRFWRGGSLMELGHFTDGLADSIWVRYYPVNKGEAPVVARRLPMRTGQPDGPFVVFHPNGRAAQRGTFQRGQLVDSLVTNDSEGHRRLLASFRVASGLAGSFRQWGSGFTAQPLLTYYSGPSWNNPYPLNNPGRYWIGQLSGGRLVGSFTEKDPDGEPRVRLLFDSAGHLQAVTNYYPGAWRRHELKEYESADTLHSHSLPALERRAVGPYLYILQRTWSWESDTLLGNSELMRVVGRPRHPKPASCDELAKSALPQPNGGSLMMVMSQAASFWGQIPKRTLLGAAQVVSKKALSTATSNELVTGRRAVPFAKQYWRVGETDTLTGRYQLLPRRELHYEAGQLMAVETSHGYKVFTPSGQLMQMGRTKRNGTRVTRQYNPDGHLRRVSWVTKKGRWLIRQRKGNGWMPLFRRPYRTVHFR